jgi:hypothetical protein
MYVLIYKRIYPQQTTRSKYYKLKIIFLIDKNQNTTCVKHFLVQLYMKVTLNG